MENPVREFRLRNHKTLQGMADEIGINYQALYLLECGCYSSVLPAVLGFLEAEGLSPLAVEDDYGVFVFRKWSRFGEDHDLRAKTLDSLGPSVGSPFEHFRNELGLSRMAFCKALAVHPAKELLVEQGQTRSLGDQLHTALSVAGLPAKVLTELENRVEEYHGSF